MQIELQKRGREGGGDLSCKEIYQTKQHPAGFLGADEAFLRSLTDAGVRILTRLPCKREKGFFRDPRPTVLEPTVPCLSRGAGGAGSVGGAIFGVPTVSSQSRSQGAAKGHAVNQMGRVESDPGSGGRAGGGGGRERSC